MFGQEPRVPVDFLLGGVQEAVADNVHNWILEHQTRLQVAFESAREWLKVVAERRKTHYDQNVQCTPLEEGQLVYLRECGIRGRHKIQDLWDPVVYQVVKAPKDGGAVYTIAPIDEPCSVRHVHRSLLKTRILRGSPVQSPHNSPLIEKVPPLEDELDEGDLLALVPEAPQASLPMPARLAMRDSIPVAEPALQCGLIPSGIVIRVPAVSGPSCSVDMSPPSVSVTVPTSLPVIDATALRRTTRATAGQHSNVYRLPRAVGEAPM